MDLTKKYIEINADLVNLLEVQIVLLTNNHD